MTHPDDIPEEMAGLMHSWEKAPQNSLLAIADFHVSFELIHPFGDGNGRVGRLLLVLPCLAAGYPPIVIENANKSEYYSLKTGTAPNRLNGRQVVKTDQHLEGGVVLGGNVLGRIDPGKDLVDPAAPPAQILHLVRFTSD